MLVKVMVKVKVDLSQKQAMRVQKGRIYIAVICLRPWLKMREGDQHHVQDHLQPRKKQYPLFRR
jgi:hypothetical protein